MEPAITRIQPPELESAATHSHPQDGISLKSYLAAKTRVSGRMESAVTRIQPPELQSAGTRVSCRIESAATRIQLRFRN